MELKRFVFNLNYKPSFSWMDKKGELLESFMQSKLFTEVGGSLDMIEANVKSKKVHRKIGLESSRLIGLIERDDITIDHIRKILKLAQQTCELMSIKKENITRIGIRFFYVGQMDFKNANDFFINMMSPELKDVISGQEYVDSAIIPVAKYNNYEARYSLGPLKRKEYPRFFARHKYIEFDEGYLFDIDSYSDNFHSFRMDKFAESVSEDLTAKLTTIEKKIKDYADAKKHN